MLWVKVSGSCWSQDKRGLKKKKGVVGELGGGMGVQNMTAVAEGDVTYCQGL